MLIEMLEIVLTPKIFGDPEIGGPHCDGIVLSQRNLRV